MILIWNLGTALLIAGLASLFGRSMLAQFAAWLLPLSARARGRA